MMLLYFIIIYQTTFHALSELQSQGGKKTKFEDSRKTLAEWWTQSVSKWKIQKISEEEKKLQIESEEESEKKR